MAETNDDTQRTPGRRQPCCVCMQNAVRYRYIKRGYLWHGDNKPLWIPWTLDLSGDGWREVSPIYHCPFCGVNLDMSEE